MAQLEIRDLTKSFDATEVIKGVNLSIQDHEFCVFLGPSGCGKSTMLRLIAGLEDVSSGQLLLAGQDITHAPAAKRNLAMVFQSYALYPHMNVRDNLSFALKLAKMPQAQIDAKLARTARTLGLDALLERKPAALSGGQRQRVAIGRAIVREPAIFLFDEPLSNLDAALRIQTRLEIARLHRELHATTIYVTHDQVEAMTLADKVVIFNGGRVEQVGPPLTLFQQPANRFVAAFLGMPSMSFIDVTVDDGSLRLPGGLRLLPPAALTLPAAPGSTLSLGLRPDQVSLLAQSTPQALPCTVEVVERLGSDTYVYVSVPGAGPVTVRVAGDDPVAVGDQRWLDLDVSRGHVFADSGQALYHPAVH
ncbi:ABC transporter ATP-binding protein [Frateuria aurantia]